MKMFEPNSTHLIDLFRNGSGYYIPLYQRQYSWPKESVTKLLDDVFDGAAKATKEPDHLVFLGAMILYPAKPEQHIHFDQNGLLPKVLNVIDGQQRLSTLALIACILDRKLKEVRDQLSSVTPHSEGKSEIEKLVTSISNTRLVIEDIYSLEVKRVGVDPDRKPIIIREHDQSSNPCADQWTLSGKIDEFYRSDIANLIALYIDNQEKWDLDNIEDNNFRLADNIREIENWFNLIEEEDFPTLEILLKSNSDSLTDFIDPSIDISSIVEHSLLVQVNLSIRLLAFSRFLTHGTYITTIECPTETLSFDMFQSLNATGTPLTPIEVFKPLVVKKVGSDYAKSKSKSYFDEIESYFDENLDSASKETITHEVVSTFAMVYEGKELKKRFSDQRDWLKDSFSALAINKHDEFVMWLANITAYWKEVIKRRKPKKNGKSNFLQRHLQQLGLSSQDADTAALCILFLKEAGHSMAHYVIVLFYGKLCRATADEKETFSTEFLNACKFCASFYIYWNGSEPGYPDSLYKKLFKASHYNFNIKCGIAKLDCATLRRNIKKEKRFDSTLKSEWIDSAAVMLGYSKRIICRFSLFMAFHDRAPHMAKEKAGLMVDGTEGSATYLTLSKWYSSDLEVIEHIANRDKPKPPYKHKPPDDNMYPGNHSVVDRLGNLTLWSRAANSSTYPEWPDKVYYYATLTKLNPQSAVDLDELKEKLQIANKPRGLENVVDATIYQPHLAPLALRGMLGMSWDIKIIKERSNDICEKLFDTLSPWLEGNN